MYTYICMYILYVLSEGFRERLDSSLAVRILDFVLLYATDYSLIHVRTYCNVIVIFTCNRFLC